MSEDFLQTVASAVNNGGDIGSTEDIAAEAAQSVSSEQLQQPQNAPKGDFSAEKTQKDLLDTFSNADKNANFFGVDQSKKKKEKTELDRELSEETEEVNDAPKRKTLSLKGKKEQASGRSIINAYLQEDAEGNLVNKKGEILAISGKSREYVQNLRKEARNYQKQNDQMAVQMVQFTDKFKDLYKDYLDIKETKTDPIQHIVKETGLNQSEVSEAMLLMKDYKANPIAAIKSLLTQAHNSGIDIKPLVGTNIVADPSVMKRQMEGLIKENLAPLNKQSDLQNQQISAQQEANAFLTQYPDAVAHQQLIAQGKQKYPHMSLPEIWLRIRQGLNARSPAKPSKQTIKRQSRAKPVTRKSAQSFVSKNKGADYSTMDYSEIAQTIMKDLDNDS